MTGWWGVRAYDVTSTMPLDDATPERGGRKLLEYAEQMNVPLAKQLAQGLRLVDGDERPTREQVARFPSVAYLGGADWTTTLAHLAGSPGKALAAGVGIDASVFGDSAWGYLLDLDERSLAVYRARPVGAQREPATEINSCVLVAEFYLAHLPPLELFVAEARDRDNWAADLRAESPRTDRL